MNPKSYLIFANKRANHFSPKVIPRTHPLDRLILITAKSTPQEVSNQFDKIYFVEENPQFDEFILAELEMGRETSDIHTLTTDETQLLTIAALREKWHLPGPTSEQILKFRNKIMMKELVRKAGVKVPKFVPLEPTIAFEDIVDIVGQPFIIKPIMGASSIQTSVIIDSDDYTRWMANMKQSANTYEAEEYLSGELYHYDSFIDKGQITHSFAFKYLHPCLEYTQQKILASIPLDQSSQTAHSLKQFNDQIIKALTPHDGPYHLECFFSNNEWYFLEIAARPPGGLIIEATKRNFNVNMYQLALEQLLELPIQTSSPPISDEIHAWAYIPRKGGVITELLQPDLKSRYELCWHVAPDERVEDTQGSVTAPPAATLWLKSKSLQDIEEDLQTLSHNLPYRYSLSPIIQK